VIAGIADRDRLAGEMRRDAEQELRRLRALATGGKPVTPELASLIARLEAQAKRNAQGAA